MTNEIAPTSELVERLKALNAICRVGYNANVFYAQQELQGRLPEIIAALTPAPSAVEAERDVLRRALEKVRTFLMSAPLESGYCCCGDKVDAHNIGSGHSPVDELEYAASKEIERIDQALAAGEAQP